MKLYLYVYEALEYIESHLFSVKSPEEISKKLNLSLTQLQKEFHVLTGFSVAEYIRNRKLYEAALEIISTNIKIIDIALKYGYDTPNSFTKAFLRFHGINPIELRKKKEGFRIFLPIKIEVSVQGGIDSKIKVLKKHSFTVVGFKTFLNEETEQQDIKCLWHDIYEKYYSGLLENGQYNEMSKCIEINSIGEYGILLSEPDGQRSYIVAGRYTGKNVPENSVIVDIPSYEWAIFDHSGPVQNGTLLYDIDEKKKWIEAASEYKPIDDICIEWYESIDEYKNFGDYKSSLWIPVSTKKPKKENSKKIMNKQVIIFACFMLLLFASAFVIYLLFAGKETSNIIEHSQNTSIDESLKNQASNKDAVNIDNSFETLDSDFHKKLIDYYFYIIELIPEENWGGAYFETDETKNEESLHILLAGKYEQTYSEKGIVYEYVKYSYLQLLSFQEKIIENKIKIGIDSLGISIKDNKVVIYHKDGSVIDLDLLNDIIPDDAYEVVNVENDSVSVNQ